MNPKHELKYHNKIRIFYDYPAFGPGVAKIMELVKERDKLFNRPQTLNTSMLTGCKNISRARKTHDNMVQAQDWGLDLVFNKRVYVKFNDDNLLLLH